MKRLCVILAWLLWLLPCLYCQEALPPPATGTEENAGSTTDLFLSMNGSLDSLEKALSGLKLNNEELERRLTDVSESFENLTEYSAMREAQYRLLERDLQKSRGDTVKWKTCSIVSISVAVPVVAVLTVALIKKEK